MLQGSHSQRKHGKRFTAGRLSRENSVKSLNKLSRVVSPLEDSRPDMRRSKSSDGVVFKNSNKGRSFKGISLLQPLTKNSPGQKGKYKSRPKGIDLQLKDEDDSLSEEEVEEFDDNANVVGDQSRQNSNQDLSSKNSSQASLTNFYNTNLLSQSTGMEKAMPRHESQHYPQKMNRIPSVPTSEIARPTPQRNLDNFSDFFNPSGNSAETRTQQKLWLQRENSILNINALSNDKMVNMSSIFKTDFEKYTIEYHSVKRYENPIFRALQRLSSRSLAKKSSKEGGKSFNNFKDFIEGKNFNHEDISRKLQTLWISDIDFLQSPAPTPSINPHSITTSVNGSSNNMRSPITPTTRAFANGRAPAAKSLV